ncbi:MAG: hypothetical protein MJ094_08130 [Saccharofermentans sp.]|nr:hypothetical protein [Saccharofermentans sp.]
MADNDNKNQLIDQDEYERALAALGKSKGERVKEIVDQKKAKKAAEKAKKEAEEKAQKEAMGISTKPTFIDKCKKDPIIPTCILALVLVLVGAFVYFIVPMLGTQTLGFTLDQFRAQYASTEIYIQNLSSYNFGIPQVAYQQMPSVALTAAQEGQESKLLYFTASIPNTATSFGTALQGSVTKDDNKVTAMRVVVEYSNDPNYVNFIKLYLASYFQAIFPDLTTEQASQLANDCITNINSENYTIRNNIAYRLSIVNEGVPYVAFDVLPASNI